jgi:hypothetical protein
MATIYAAVRDVFGSSSVDVLAIGDTREQLRFVGGDRVLGIWYRAGCRAPRVGERLDTWTDVSTPYVMAPRY